MKCPYCGAEESKVIDSRPTEDNERIRRRRECLNCHMRFTTYEVVETVPLVVIKKDNSREPFDRQKLFNAMLRACAKRPVSYETLERAVSSIEQALFSSYDREIPSVRIGELTMEELKKIDEVAYIRFASVYRQFADVESFPVLLDFWASWCGPCRMLSPVVDEVAEERTDVKVGKVNVDEQPDLAAQFGVMSIPTLLVFEQGKLVRQAVGARPKAGVLELLG